MPFTRTLRLWPVGVLAVGYLLALFDALDRRAFARERSEDLARDVSQRVPMRVDGWVSVAFLAVLVMSVFLPTPIREGVMILAALASVALGSRPARRANGFTYGPVVEVAILFAGIFVTMVPALALLEVHGGELGLTRPWPFFLTTGALSSVLDNAPTYLTLLSAAQGLGLAPEVVGVPNVHLVAISAGAVLMGANTYIGNDPSFTVKAIADEAGFRTPSFGAYALRAIGILAPIYVAVTLALALASP